MEILVIWFNDCNFVISFQICLLLVCQTGVLFGAKIYDWKDVFNHDEDNVGQEEQWGDNESDESIDLGDRGLGHNQVKKVLCRYFLTGISISYCNNDLLKAEFYCVEETVQRPLTDMMNLEDFDDFEFEYYPEAITEKICKKVSPKTHQNLEHLVLARGCNSSIKSIPVFMKKRRTNNHHCWQKHDQMLYIRNGCILGNGK